MYFNDTRNRLKDDAVPTLFLETNGNDLDFFFRGYDHEITFPDQPEPQEEPGGLLRKLLCEPKETPASSERVTFEFVHCDDDDDNDDDVQIIEPAEPVSVNEKTVEKDCVELRRMLMTYEHKRDRRKEPQDEPIQTAPEDDNCILRNILLSYKHTQDTEAVPVSIENVKTVEKDCTELRKMLLYYEQRPCTISAPKNYPC